MSFKETLLRRLPWIGSSSKERSNSLSTDVGAATTAKSAHGLEPRHDKQSVDSTKLVEPTGGWPLKEAMEPANNPEAWYHAAPPNLRGEGYVLGVDPRNGRPKGMLGEQRTHSYVLGKSGTAKSTFLLSQMLQDVERGESVIALDPHADLARKFLSHIPKDRWKDVIYVNPLAAKEWGRVVRLNFLQHVPEADRELAKRAFMSALKKIHPNAWGYRMESIMRYALNLVYANMEFPTLSDLLDAIGDRNKRREEEFLPNSKVDKETRNFWKEDYGDFRDDFKVAAQDKIYTLASENDLKPMTITKRSDADFYEAMNEGKIVVMDIPEGKLSGSLTNYLGTLLLMRVYQAAIARENVPGEERKPVHLYIDEAHRFMSEVIQDNMRTLRKFGIFVTGASQNLQEYGEVMENEVQELADTLMAFKCGERTAQRISASFPTLGVGKNKEAWQAITNLPYYTFYVSTPVGGVTEVRVVETVDVGWGPHYWKDVAVASLNKYGTPTEKRMMDLGKLAIPTAKEFTPVQYFMLSILAEERSKKESNLSSEEDDSVDWRLGKDHLYNRMKERYNFKSDEVYDAVKWLGKDMGYVGSKPIPKKSDGTKTTVKRKYFHITRAGLKAIYPRLRGTRTGKKLHITMICQMIDRYRKKDFYSLPITEDTGGIKSGKSKYYPDLLVYPPYRAHSGRYSSNSWDPSSVFAVEVEAFPTGSRKKDLEEDLSEGTGSHLDRTVEHFMVMRDVLEIPVVFVTQNEHDAETVRSVLKEAGANIREDEPTKMTAGDAKVIVMNEPLPPNELQVQVKKSVEYAREESRSKGGLEESHGVEESSKSGGTNRESGRSKIKLPASKSARKLRVGGTSEGRKNETEGGLPEIKTSVDKEGADWEKLVGKYKEMRRSDQPPEKLAEVLFDLREAGCKFRITKVKGMDYLQILKYEDNKQKTRSARSINENVEKALGMVGVDI